MLMGTLITLSLLASVLLGGGLNAGVERLVALNWGARPAIPLAASGSIPAPLPGTLEPWMLSLCAWLSIIVLIFTVILLGKQLFGRQPAIHVELETVSKKHKELEEKLLGKIDCCLTREFFDEYRKERTRDINALQAAIAEVQAELEKQGTANYRGRRSLHKQVNSHGEALAFIAGGMGGRGAQVRQIVAKGQGEEAEG
jgi:hypothetical protein